MAFKPVRNTIKTKFEVRVFNDNFKSIRLYKELAWESHSNRRKLHLLSQFHKIVKNLKESYYF